MIKKKKKLKEGRVIAVVDYNFDKSSYTTIITGLKCETDFLSRNIIFEDALLKISDGLTKNKGSKYIDSIIENLSKESKERVEFVSSFCLKSTKSTLSSYYVHHDNKKIAIVQFESDSKYEEEVKKIAYDIAMHIVAFSPSYLKKEYINWDEVDLDIHESILKNKPANIIEKIKVGKKVKYAKENVLLEQPFVKDMSKTVSGIIEEFNKKNNTNIRIVNYHSIII